jgi:hypothetical protein
MSVERFGLDPDGKLGFSNDDVVMFQTGNFSLDKMTKISSLLQALEPWAQRNSNNKASESVLFSEKGLDCQVLRVSGGGWQKGRIRFRLEFVPDEPPPQANSPLADLRSNLDI